MPKVDIIEWDLYTHVIADRRGKLITYKDVTASKPFMDRGYKLISTTVSGHTVQIGIRRYELSNPGSYISSTLRHTIIQLCFDADGNLRDTNAHDKGIKEYRTALEECAGCEELTQYVPYILRWLHDHEDQSEEVLRL